MVATVRTYTNERVDPEPPQSALATLRAVLVAQGFEPMLGNAETGLTFRRGALDVELSMEEVR